MWIDTVVEYLYPARFCIFAFLLAAFLMFLFFKKGMQERSDLTRLFIATLTLVIVAVSIQTVLIFIGKNGVNDADAGLFRALVRAGTLIFIAVISMIAVYMNALAYEKNEKTRTADRVLKIIWCCLLVASSVFALVLPVKIPGGQDVICAEHEYYYFLEGYIAAYLLNHIVNFFINRRKCTEDEFYFYITNMLISVYTMFSIFHVPRTASLTFFEVVGVLSLYLFIENLDKKEKEKYREDKMVADLANSAKSSFLSNISHEIRTPLNAIIGINEMIKRDYADEPSLIEHTTDINNASHTLLGIVNTLLDLGKIETGRVDRMECEFDLARVLNEASMYMKTRVEAKGLEFEEYVDPGVPGTLFGDAEKLRQIVSNLGTNAVKYTEAGKVALRVECERMEGVPGIELIITVADTGRGIKPEDLPRLYDKFKRFDVKNSAMIEGAGLGMSIVAQYLEILDGKIDIRSKYGKGSRFTVRIPFVVVDDEPVKDLKTLRKLEAEKEKAETKEHDFSGKDILVVDDSLINLKVFEGLLRTTGANVVCLSSGKAAVERVRTEHFDIIFLDHMMPEMDGIETLRQMKQMPVNKSARTPVVALTANALVGARDEYISAGFSNYVSKPVDVKILLEMIDGYVNGEKN